MPKENGRSIRITIIARRKRLLDADNAYVKPIIDSLKKRFIPDDDPSFVKKVNVRQERAETPSVTVIIEYEETNGNNEEVFNQQMKKSNGKNRHNSKIT